MSMKYFQNYLFNYYSEEDIYLDWELISLLTRLNYVKEIKYIIFYRALILHSIEGKITDLSVKLKSEYLKDKDIL